MANSVNCAGCGLPYVSCICRAGVCIGCGFSVPNCVCLARAGNYYPRPFTYGSFEEGTIENEIERRVQERFISADKPVITEPYVGYRVWHYNDGYLQSAFKTEFKWPFRKALTKDVYQNEGIHAIKEYKGIIPLLKAYCWPIDGSSNTLRSPREGTRGIAGSLYMWGEVQEHTGGYLAEFAYPKELYVDEFCDILTIMQLEENYGVPVQIRAELNPGNLFLDTLTFSQKLASQMASNQIMTKASAAQGKMWTSGSITFPTPFSYSSKLSKKP